MDVSWSNDTSLSSQGIIEFYSAGAVLNIHPDAMQSK